MSDEPLLGEYVVCPICRAPPERLRPLGVYDCSKHPNWSEPLPRVLEWRECAACGHQFTRYLFTGSGRRVLFTKAHSDQIASETLPALEQARMTWAVIVQRAVDLLGFLPGVGGRQASWLDVGFGNGGLVMTANEFGFSARGLDAREVAVNALQAAGFAADQGDFMDYRPPEPFNVVSFADVLEHMVDPSAAVGHARTIVRPGGLLFVSFPNRDSPVWSAMNRGNANPYWVEIEHHHNFGRGSAMTLLQHHGFEPCAFGISQRYRAGMEIWARRMP